MMNKKINYSLLETIGSITWLIMDFIWLCGFVDISLYFSFIPFTTLALAFILYDGAKNSEMYGLLASWLWLFMNIFWILSEKNLLWLVFAKMVFIYAAIAII